ncbi:hypothetical protein [Dyadobacter fermentans]|uniref:hypothetical protein n=1 Tax=Dyadobacter fermentans TaxID=94254 RepID=UPI001CC06ACE|nr:hypothetical protein [Dyadobacter fermentans]MBZ1362018.1 hypothetical protein [Dyadobacter fermentans]
MRNLLLAALLACCQLVTAQSIDQVIDGKIKASEARQKAYADSLFKVKGDGGGTQNPPNGLKPCPRGPKPEDIYNVTTSTAMVLWDGEDVRGWDYSIYKGSTRVAFASVKPTGNREPITYAGLEPGEYTLSMQGNTCKSDVYSKTFVVPKPTGDGNGGDGGNSGPPPTSKGDRQIIMNLTGYGFDVNAPTGISSEWLERIEAFCNLNYNGKKFRGIDGIRVNVKWYSYQPNDKTFRDDKILDLINYCKSRGLKLSIALIPWRVIGDGMIDRSEWLEQLPDPFWKPSEEEPTQDLVWHAEGSLRSTERTYMPSLHSKDGQDKFKKAARHLAEFMAKYPDYVDYISTATSTGEEYENNIQRATNNQILLTGYGQADLNAWREYSGGLPVPYPAQNNEEHISYLFTNSESGKKWYEFRTKGLKEFHAAFVQGVREGGKGKVRSMGMYAGAGAPSGPWTGLYKLNEIFSAGTSDQPDMIYSSEGDAGSQNRKLMATDLNGATFPGAARVIEFDPNDLSVDQDWQTSPEEDVNGDILYYWLSSFFKRGGDDASLAMAFYAPKINAQLGPALYRIRSEFIDSDSGMTGIAQGDGFTFTITRYAGLQEYNEMYSQRGGGANKVVKITLK